MIKHWVLIDLSVTLRNIVPVILSFIFYIWFLFPIYIRTIKIFIYLKNINSTLPPRLEGPWGLFYSMIQYISRV